MSNIVRMPQGSLIAPRDFNKNDLKLIRDTVAKDCDGSEFELFISYCQSLGLDPRRKQIYALVYNKDDAKKRKMSIIVGIDGFRSIAARTGNYRPDDDPPHLEYDPTLRSETNPTGLVSATVKVWQFSHGQWFKIAGAARWDEFAPIEDEWAWSDEKNKRVRTGKKKPGGKWADMPTIMLAKCAEAQALRRGWPDNFSAVYAPEEMDQANVEVLSPIEAIEQAEQEQRLKRIGGHGIIVDWLEEGKPLDYVPVGQFADRVFEFIEKNREEPSVVLSWKDRNTVALREFWAYSAGDCDTIKREIEAIVNAPIAGGTNE